jgi:hypothetical protein
VWELSHPDLWKEEPAMSTDQSALVKEFQAQFAKKVKETEIESLEYWKEQLDKLLIAKPEGVAALQAQVRKVANMMGTRINTLKRT